MNIIHQDELTEGEQVPSITNLFIFLWTGYNLQLKLNQTGYGNSLVWALSLESFLERQWKGKW